MRIPREKLVAFAILLLASVVNVIWLSPELRISRIDLNDNVLHYTLVERIVDAVRSGENPLDCWSPEWSFGFPVLRDYQPLAHWMVAGVFLALGKSVPLMTVFVIFRFLSVALLPLSFFVAARGLCLSRLTAAAAALLAPLVSTEFLYGIEHTSFVWAGAGLFPQAVAVHLFLLSLAAGWRAIREGRRTILAGVLVGLTLLAHLIYGYMAAMSLVLAAALPAGVGLALRIRRLVAIGAAAFAVSAFQLIPLLRDGDLINHSRWESAWKWDSFGAANVLQRLLKGELLDFGRLPLLSVLAFAGLSLLAWDLWRRRSSTIHVWLAMGAAFWILMFFGREFWGPALTVLGISGDMHLHRVIGGVQVFLILLAAVALNRFWTELAARRLAIVALAATVFLVYPLAADRARYLGNNAVWGRRNLERYEAERHDIEAAIANTREHGGRAYAGLAATWGGQFKVGDVPFYAFLATANVPAVSYLYHSMALTGDLMVRFVDQLPAHYRLFNIRTLITATAAVAPPGMLAQRAQFGRFRLYDAPGNGYFDIVDADTVVKVNKRSFYDINDRWLRSDLPGKRSHLLLEFRDPAPAGLPRIAPDGNLPFLASPPPDPGRVTAESQSGSQDFRAETETLRPAWVLFKMTYHPNWAAYVDGERRPVYMLSPGFSGVALPPGKHRIEFRYESGPAKAILLVAGILLLALAARGPDAVSRACETLLSRASLPKQAAGVAGLIVLALPVAIPLFTGSLLWGHDAFSYFPRIVEVHRNFQHGILLPRWAPDLGRGAGQPLFLFHPPLFYWIAELWNLVGFGVIAGVNLAAAVVVFASVWAAYLLGSLWFGRMGGWLAAAAYLYAPYFAIDLYVRSSMEEFTVFPLAAFALYGFGSYALTGSKPKWILGTVAFSAILFSHFPAALLFAPLLVVYLLLTAWMSRSRRVAVMHAGGFALALALAAWSWIPAIVERRDISLDRALAANPNYSYKTHFVTFSQLFHSDWGYGYSVAGPADGMSFSLGWEHLVLAVIAALWAIRKLKPVQRPLVRLCVGAAIVYALLTTAESAFLWERLPLLANVQLPWRLLQPASLCLAVLIAALAPALDSLGRYRNAACAAALALLIVPGLSHLHAGRTAEVDPALWTPTYLATSGFETTTSGEVTPRWVASSPPYSPSPGAPIMGDAEIVTARSTPFEWTGRIHAKSPAIIEAARAYFPGWTVRIDGANVDLKPSQPTGRLQFPVPPGDHDFQVTWSRSPIRRIAEWISLAAILAAAAILKLNHEGSS